MEQNPVRGWDWIAVSIWTGAGGFLLALALSAMYIPELRLLHSFQALIYVVVLVLSRRNSPWGFGAAVIVATAWNCLGLFVTHLTEAGVGELWSLMHGGHVTRPDTLMVLGGTMAHFLLIVACVAGFLRLRPGKRRWGQFFAGGVLAMAYFALIIALTAPR